jgi:hypothetical protein
MAPVKHIIELSDESHVVARARERPLVVENASRGLKVLTDMDGVRCHYNDVVVTRATTRQNCTTLVNLTRSS